MPKGIWRSTGGAPLLLKPGIRWWPVSLKTRLIGPRGERPPTPTEQEAGQTRKSAWTFCRRGLPCQKSNPESSSQQPSRYTDCYVPVPVPSIVAITSVGLWLLLTHAHATRPSIRILRDRSRFTDCCLSLPRYTKHFPDVGVKTDGHAEASG